VADLGLRLLVDLAYVLRYIVVLEEERILIGELIADNAVLCADVLCLLAELRFHLLLGTEVYVRVLLKKLLRDLDVAESGNWLADTGL
jgi:hypothetical protein